MAVVFGIYVLSHYNILAVIFLPAHPASFTHNFFSRMQSFYFRESQDAIVLQICHENSVLDS